MSDLLHFRRLENNPEVAYKGRLIEFTFGRPFRIMAAARAMQLNPNGFLRAYRAFLESGAAFRRAAI
jgi:hypothetical protein